MTNTLTMNNNTFQKRADLFRDVLEALRYAVFGLFYVLSLRIVFITLTHTPQVVSIAVGGVALVIAVLTCLKTEWVLYGFVIGIPLVSGFQVIGFMDDLPFLSVAFASIYLVWLPKRMFLEKRGILPDEPIGHTIDVLSAIVLISLIMLLAQYPVDFVLNRLWFYPFVTQDQPLYGIDGSCVLLQGLFFYRVMELEIKDPSACKRIVPIFILQSSVIILFSSYQLILQLMGPKRLAGLYFPFEDIHSCGSYVSLLFFCLFTTIGSNKNLRGLGICFVLILLPLMVLSYSRATWLAAIVIGAIFLFNRYKGKKRILVICGIFACGLYVNFFHYDLVKSKNKYAKRLGTLVIAEHYVKDPTIVGRLVRWRIPLRIIRDYPITGSGIGTYFRLSPLYVTEGDRQEVLKTHREWKSAENAHNYYLQLAADMGIPVLFIFLLIICYVYKAGLAVLRRSGEQGDLVKGLLFGLGAYLITMLTGHPLLLSNQQFLFWFVIGTIVICSKHKIRSHEQRRLSEGLGTQKLLLRHE